MIGANGWMMDIGGKIEDVTIVIVDREGLVEANRSFESCSNTGQVAVYVVLLPQEPDSSRH